MAHAASRRTVEKIVRCPALPCPDLPCPALPCPVIITSWCCPQVNLDGLLKLVLLKSQAPAVDAYKAVSISAGYTKDPRQKTVR